MFGIKMKLVHCRIPPPQKKKKIKDRSENLVVRLRKTTFPNHVPKVTTGAQSHDFMAKKISERSGLTFLGAYVHTVPVWLTHQTLPGVPRR